MSSATRSSASRAAKPEHGAPAGTPQPAPAKRASAVDRGKPGAPTKPVTAKPDLVKPAPAKPVTAKPVAAPPAPKTSARPLAPKPVTPPKTIATPAAMKAATPTSAAAKPAKPASKAAPAADPKATRPTAPTSLKATVTQIAKPAAKSSPKTAAKPPVAADATEAKPQPAPRKAMTNAAATQALMASAAASKEAAVRNAARAAADKATAEKAIADKAAAAAAAPPVQVISPPIASRPGMSRPGMPGMRPAFSITPRMPMGALRSGGMAETQAGAPNAPKGPPVKVDFRTGDMVVYPTHGVGTVQGIEDVNVAGISLQVITVTFEENRMTLRVPTNKAASAGLRKLAGPALVKLALDTLKGRACIKRTMWSRRAQEYEAKINSGDPVAIAEVVRDLFRNAGQPDQSFSERQIYEQALDRLAMEFAAIEKTDKPTAIERLIAHMRSAEKPGAKPVEEPIEED